MANVSYDIFSYQLYVKILFNIFKVNLNEKYDRLPTFFLDS